MKISLHPASRWPRIPLWAVGFVALWASVAIAARIVSHYTGVQPDLCLFHRLTGEPCPTCGTTRGLLALARGAWRESFLWNPMTMAGGWAIALAALGRMITGKTLALEFTPGEKRALGFLGLGVLLVNWVWLMYSHP